MRLLRYNCGVTKSVTDRVTAVSYTQLPPVRARSVSFGLLPPLLWENSPICRSSCGAHLRDVYKRQGVGYDSVDVKKATELGIPVVITPGANNRSVAEHAVAMMFALRCV